MNCRIVKKLHVNTKGCSGEKLKKLAKHCGFTIRESKKHIKVSTQEDGFVAMIPRHNPLKRETAKGIVEAFVKFGAKIDFV